MTYFCHRRPPSKGQTATNVSRGKSSTEDSPSTSDAGDSTGGLSEGSHAPVATPVGANHRNCTHMDKIGSTFNGGFIFAENSPTDLAGPPSSTHVVMVSSAVLIVGGGLAVATSVFAMLRKRQKKAHDAPPTDGKRTLKRSGTSFVIGKPIGAPTPELRGTARRAASYRTVPSYARREQVAMGRLFWSRADHTAQLHRAILVHQPHKIQYSNMQHERRPAYRLNGHGRSQVCQTFPSHQPS